MYTCGSGCARRAVPTACRPTNNRWPQPLLATGSLATAALLWRPANLATAAPKTSRAKTPLPHNAQVTSTRSRDGTRLGTGSDDHTVKIWSSDHLSSWPGALGSVNTGSEVNAVCFIPDGSRLASAHADSALKMWDSSNLAVPLAVGPRWAFTGKQRASCRLQPRRHSPGHRVGRHNGEDLEQRVGPGHAAPHVLRPLAGRLPGRIALFFVVGYAC